MEKSEDHDLLELQELALKQISTETQKCQEAQVFRGNSHDS